MITVTHKIPENAEVLVGARNDMYEPIHIKVTDSDIAD